MTIRSAPFTPEVFISAPRRSAAIPNGAGTLIAYTQTSYSFESHSTSSELRVLDVSSKKSVLITDAFSGAPQWLGDYELVWLKGGENGNSSLILGDAQGEKKPYSAGVIPGPVGDLKVVKLETGGYAFAVSGKANPDGSLYNPSDSKKPHSSGKLYTSLFVRHWDEWRQPQRNAIWFGALKQAPSSSTYKASSLTNVIQLMGLKNVESPIPPFGGTDNFDICSRGIAFVAKDPTLDEATHTKCVCYYCPISSWTDPQPVKEQKIAINLNGALTCPVISPVNHTLAFLAMKEDGYESDKNQLIFAKGIFDGRPEVTELFATADGTGSWVLNPSSITWAHDDSYLLILAGEQGRGHLYLMPMFDDVRAATVDQMTKLTDSGSVSSVVPTPSGLFVSSSSLVESSSFSIIRLSGSTETTVISSNSQNGGSFGLSYSQVDEIWWKGARDRNVHAFVVKPSNFKEGQKYPLCFLVHGGPQGAWMDDWNTRWNPAVFAEQGYVVVAPNPTGSTTYGQEFVDDIQGSWGGRPYEDLVKCFEHIEQHMDYVDTTRAVALGPSYGGFMMNWIQGHDLGRKFKALVTHDGIFSTKFCLAQEELYFPLRDLQGTYWDNRETWLKWDPSEYISEWKTPHLVIHSARDYRISMAEGLATFNSLQLRGVESAFLMFPDENHWVLKPENSLVWYRTAINWINKYVGLPLLVDEDGNSGLPVETEEQKLVRATAQVSMLPN